MNQAIYALKIYGIEYDNRTLSDFTENDITENYKMKQKYKHKKIYLPMKINYI